MPPDRVTKLNAQVEYADLHRDRVTKLVSQIEYANLHKDRMTKLVIQVEWCPPPSHVRKFGPAIQ